jgi:lipopolysaccharide/colanic/teichoic acid biosynthesis glycosyltransferase
VTIKTFRFRILIADLCWAVSAMAMSYGLRYAQTWESATRLPILDFFPFLLFTIFFWSALSSWTHLDGFRGGWRFPAILSQLFPSVAVLMVLLFAGAYLARWYTSRLTLNIFAILFFLGLILIRVLARVFLASRFRSGAVRKCVIVGSGSIATEIARKIESHPETLWEVAGFLCPAESAPSLASSEVGSAPVNVRSVGIAELLKQRSIDELILAVSRPDHPEISDLVARCLHQGIRVSVVPQPYQLYLSRPKLIDLDGLPLIKMEGLGAAHATPGWKRALDITLATSLMLISGPALLIVAACFKLGKGKGFRAEIRCGQFAEPFRMYRLNSDRHSDELSLPEFVMQQTSFTELPQLLNVIRGEMSLVGPRPEPPERVQHYSDWHRQRLTVAPGITGLAQVLGLRDQNSSEDKTRYDLEYILHRSLFLDVSLLLQTLWTLALRCFKLKQRKAQLSPTHSDVAVVPMPVRFEENLSSAHSSQSGTD